MLNQFSRTELLLGSAAIEALGRSRVAVFGLGGVGGYVCEALVRSGVGHFDLIDHDTVSLTNLNRQIIATRDSIGRDKADVMGERMLGINPEAEIIIHKCFYLPENAELFDFSRYDYVVDAIDTVAAKLNLAQRCSEEGIPIICACGTGNRLDPTALRVSDISETSGDPLARVLRKELKKRGVKKLKTVWSRELPLEPLTKDEADMEYKGASMRPVPGSCAFVPAAAGLLIASEVVKDLTARVGGRAPRRGEETETE